MRSLTSSSIIFVAIIAFAMSSCEKSDSRLAYGEPKVFIPQAAISANRYAVPNTGIGLDSATRNYVLTNDSVRIILGVNHSGSRMNNSFTTTVYAATDTVNQLITTNVFPASSTVVLPSDLYSLPTMVGVNEGGTGGTFYLTINRAKLKSMYSGKTVLAGVGIKDPTAFSINPSISKVIVVINVTALNL